MGVELRGQLEFAQNHVSVAAIATGSTVDPGIPGVRPVSVNNPFPIASVSGNTGARVGTGPTVYTNVPANQDFTVVVSGGTRAVIISGASFAPDEGCIALANNVKRQVSGDTQTFEYLPVDDLRVDDNGDDTYTVTFSGLTETFNTTDQVKMAMFGPPRVTDTTVDARKSLVQNSDADRDTDLESYTTFVPVDTNYDEGGVIDVRGKNVLNLYYSKTLAVSDDTNVKVVYLESAVGTVDYQMTELGTSADGVRSVLESVFLLDKGAAVNMISFDTKGAPFMRIDMAKATDVGDDSTITCSINKAYI